MVIRTRADGDMERWMQWVLMVHARRYNRHYRTTGHVWQCVISVLRYVELNARRAELVARS